MEERRKSPHLSFVAGTFGLVFGIILAGLVFVNFVPSTHVESMMVLTADGSSVEMTIVIETTETTEKYMAIRPHLRQHVRSYFASTDIYDDVVKKRKYDEIKKHLNLSINDTYPKVDFIDIGVVSILKNDVDIH